MKNMKMIKRSFALVLAGIMMSASVGVYAAETPPDPPSGEMGTPPEGGGGGEMGMPPGGSSSSDLTYSGATEVTGAEILSAGNYSSTTADENAILVDTSEEVTISSPTVSKTGDSDGGDNCNFYGINSAVTVKGGSATYITGGSITATAEGANGVFSYGGNGGQNGAAGDGTTVYITDTEITTSGNNGGGIMTTGGGVMVAKNLTVNTSGRSSAAIRTDRGGGTVTVTGGSYTSAGQGSPAIYSTADITVNDAELASAKSEGVCIEGKNSITLNNSTLTASNTALNGNATFYDTIMIYQSQSGDAADGTSSFSMTGGTLNSLSGHVFHVTNTSAVINLNGTDIYNYDDENVLISVCDDGWSGAGNEATLNATDQTLEGSILVGDDSTLTLNMAGSTTFLGNTSGQITNGKGETVSSSIGTVNVTMSGGEAVWVLTDDSEISSIQGSGKINYNGHTLTVGGVAYTSGSPASGIEETTETVKAVTKPSKPTIDTSKTIATGSSSSSGEWINGSWYSSDGSSTYTATMSWMQDGKGWWIEDTAGWYPVSEWQKIDGVWYYFDANGYMAENEWYDGYWLGEDGALTYEYTGDWSSDSNGWWYSDSSGWYATSSWQKIDGSWYYFGSDGYMATSTYIDNYWVGADGVCE